MKILSSNISASAIAACVLASVWSLGVFAVDNSSSARENLASAENGNIAPAARAKGGEDVVGNGGDTIHLNEAGEKIQAEVWLKTLFGNLDVERRITELLSRMTLEEKIGQLSQTNGGNPSGAQSEDMSEAPLDPAFLAELAAGRYGSLLGKRGAKNYNILQEAAMSGRLGIPLLVGHDMIHSSRTCFPIPLALSCAFDDDLWERIGAAIAVESLTVGCNWTFTPMIDVARDARWGRIAESAGSDPLVTSRFGVAMVRGLQGDDLADGRHIAACAKHYVAYGAPLGGRDYNAVELSDATLRDIYLPPFRAAVAAGVATVMPAFHSFNDVPCSMNSYLLRDILRGEMGFKGMTISDWEAVGELVPHGVATPGADAAAKALNAGMDMEMVSTHYADGLAEAVASGIVREETLDAAVRNVLRLKFRMGLFDHPTIDAPALEKTIDFAAHRALAREAAAKSCVLLKNGGVLPLKAPRVALLGDIAVNFRQMQGTWSTFDFSNTTNDTLLAGLLADGVSVSYTEAYTLTGRVDRAAIERACAEADAVIACFGDYLEKTGESNSSARIELPGEQLAVVDAVKACGKPLVAVVFGGRPLAIPELAEKADAIVMAWNPGGAGGWGVADVLTGAAEPYGRLTTDFPNATGECPKFYNRTTTGRHHVPGARWTTRYNDVPFSSVYPFGYGLAYTTFEYGGERVAVDGAEVVFSADITNTGSRGGSELVQVYTRDVLARTVRPRRELKGYQRVELAPGETKRVEIRVPVATLGYTVDKVYRVEPGEFEAWIAPDSDRGRKLIFTL